MAIRGSIYIQGQTAKLSFDDALTVPQETHTFGNDVVTQTLEDGSMLVDHIIVLQDELECQIFVSNSKQQESQDTYAALKTMRNNRELCTVFTDHEIYENMAIESVTAPHEAPMVNCMTFTIKFKRIDWTGAVKNTFPPAQFQWDGGDAPGESSNQVTQGMQDASKGYFDPPQQVDMTACQMADVGDMTAVEV